jgi:fructokinase
VGETVLDIIFKQAQPHTVRVGGSALNTAVSLATLGNALSFISEIGSDHVGDMCIDFLQSRGIDISLLQRYESRQTAIALAFLNEENNASYQFYKDETPQCECSVPQFRRGDFVLVASSFALKERNRAFLQNLFFAAHQSGATIFYDPNMRRAMHPHLPEYRAFRENCENATIVRCSDDDCVHIWGHCNTALIYKELQICGVQLFVCTYSSEKVEVFAPSGTYSFNVSKIPTVSTVGAGDTFNAALLHSIHAAHTDIRELSEGFYAQALPFAIHCAGRVCQSFDNYLLDF